MSWNRGRMSKGSIGIPNQTLRCMMGPRRNPFMRHIYIHDRHWPLILKLERDRAGFSIFVLVFVLRDSELDHNVSGDFRKKISSDLNEMWYVGRGRWVMHDGMPYGRIQRQGQGHQPLNVWIPSIFKTYLLFPFLPEYMEESADFGSLCCVDRKSVV